MIKEFFNRIKPYLKDTINNLKKFHTWKTQLTIAINFMSLKGKDKDRVVHWKSDNVEMMISYKDDEVIKELFQSLLSPYQIGLETTMKGSNFIFDWVHL